MKEESKEFLSLWERTIQEEGPFTFYRLDARGRESSFLPPSGLLSLSLFYLARPPLLLMTIWSTYRNLVTAALILHHCLLDPRSIKVELLSNGTARHVLYCTVNATDYE